MAKYTKTIKIRQSFKQPLIPSKNPLSLKPSRHHSLAPLRSTPIPTPSISSSLAQLISVPPYSTLPQISEIATVLESMLQTLISSAPSSFKPNKIIQARLNTENREKQDSMQKEIKRKKREQSLKQQLLRVKEERGKKLEEERNIEKEKEDELISKKEQRRQKEIERKKKLVEDMKKVKILEIERIKKEEEEEEKGQAMDKKNKNKQFIKEQTKRIKERLDKDTKERQEIEGRRREIQDKESVKVNRMKKQMEGFLKNKDVKEVHAREREEIERFYKEDTKDLMEMYDTQLMGMYKYYTLQGNIPLEGNIEKRMNAIEFNNWVKFGYNTNITPHLVSSEDIVSIYRILEREMDKNVKGDTKEGFAKYIDYEHFKKGLIRITIL